MHKSGMMKRRKGSYGLLFVLVICLTLGMVFPVYAQKLTEANPESGYAMIVDDQAGLLSTKEQRGLLDAMRVISDYGNVGFVSVYSHPYSSEFDFADEYFHSEFGKESGTIFVVDMKLRKLTVFSDGEIYRTVTKGYASTITDNIYTYASDGEYYTCALKAFEQIQRLLEGKRIAQPMKYTSNLLLALILALLINYLRARLNSGASKTSDSEWLKKIAIQFAYKDMEIRKTGTSKRYNPPSSSSDGSGGGGGGGGSSGGGGSHSF